MKKSAIVPQKVNPYRKKRIPLLQPNVIEDDEGKEPTNYQHKVHMSPSDPSIIPPEVPIPPPRLKTVQPPSVETGGPSSNLKSRGKRNPLRLYVLTAQY